MGIIIPWQKPKYVKAGNRGFGKVNVYL